MNVCLIRPPALIDVEGFAIDPVPPIGLAYIASAIFEAGHHVQVIDAIGESPRQYNPTKFKLNLTHEYKTDRLYTNGLSNDEIIANIEDETQVIGISCMFSNNWLADRALIADVKKAFPDSIIIAGGESISAKPELWMEQAQGLEICVLGEGEETIVDLLDCLEHKGDLNLVQGIAYTYGNNGQVIHTPRRVRIKDINQIALPKWDLFPLENYEKYKLQYTVTTTSRTFPVMATRGCPYSCTFCSSPQMWGTRYYMRTPQLVADEIEDLINKYGVDEIDFYDLTAIIKKEWIIEFAKELIQRNIKISWNMPAGTRSEAIDEEVATYLQLSGCKNITYAPESGSLRMLKLIKKKVSLPQMLRSMRSSNQHNMRIYINMILALPEERHRDIRQTLWFLVKCSWVGVYEVGIAMFHPYPGSALFEKLLKEQRIDLSKDDFFYNTITITPLKECDFHYNDNVSAKWYRFYNIMCYLVFFSSNYLFRPIRFFRLLKNIAARDHKSRFERTISRIVHNEKFNVKTGIHSKQDV
jgi:radical SAM superfamily enzyme YgiQ (UPF0313 family)